MGLNWAKQRHRDLGNAARRAAIDDARYVAELSQPRSGSDPQYMRGLERGPINLKCTCGHVGAVNTAKHSRFRCSSCGRLWTC